MGQSTGQGADSLQFLRLDKLGLQPGLFRLGMFLAGDVGDDRKAALEPALLVENGLGRHEHFQGRGADILIGSVRQGNPENDIPAVFQKPPKAALVFFQSGSFIAQLFELGRQVAVISREGKYLMSGLILV